VPVTGRKVPVTGRKVPVTGRKVPGNWPKGAGDWPKGAGDWPKGAGDWPKGADDWPKLMLYNSCYQQKKYFHGIVIGNMQNALNPLWAPQEFLHFLYICINF
jgi:hypothetical protein